MSLQTITLAHTQGFCAGVDSAIEIVHLALAKYGAPLYVRHEIVHNTSVIRDFELQGVVFIEDLSDVPDNTTVIFSAHGTAPEVHAQANLRGLKIIDATCPLVTKVHRQALKFSERGVQTIVIGHRGHQELLGTSGYIDPALLFIVETVQDVDSLVLDVQKPIGYLTQTTLSIDDTRHMIARLKERFPTVEGPTKANICYATQNRQDSIKELAEICDVVVVCGSPKSSNSNRLRETAANMGVPSYIIDTVEELDFSWFEGKVHLGLTSGASVPRYVVDAVVACLKTRYPTIQINEETTPEVGIRFPIPAI
ncbi:MAG: 4-hydroxy-3-methylbut-2-enyl diphosphate reductase [Candidatus Margulisbacteria bacterium]|nr:4-hydroxy-3-methylbut-2-enyl diphosphate reductase [Candidatus Margulisiibacteriota bacterium]